jgi:hypothetical protein
MFSESQASAIRFPSTSNLLIDSKDRVNLASTSSTDFTITKQTNILSGYFTRFGVVEIILNYAKPNISTEYNTNILSFTVNNVTESITFATGNYNVNDLFKYLLEELNAGSNLTVPNPALNLFPNVVFEFTGQSGSLSLFAFTNTGATQTFTINDTPLARMINFSIGKNFAQYPVLRPYLIPPQLRYLDFVCNNLTYQQGLKDASTSDISRDILYRWVLGWDNVYDLDNDGYPINQGYYPFVQRRYLNFPKMIKWDTQQPIGQLSFQTYDASGKIVESDNITRRNDSVGNLDYNMCLLVSEQ